MFSKLEKNIVEVIKEEQAKLGYMSENIRLYYPLQSLNRMINTNLDSDNMLKLLDSFRSKAEEYMGNIKISCRDDRFCFLIPPKGADYVHSIVDENDFTFEFVEIMRNHHADIDDIISCFMKYNPKTIVEKSTDEDFDYMIYFPDEEPNEFRYLIKNDGGHMIYHRLTLDDYNEFYK